MRYFEDTSALTWLVLGYCLVVLGHAGVYREPDFLAHMKRPIRVLHGLFFLFRQVLLQCEETPTRTNEFGYAFTDGCPEVETAFLAVMSRNTKMAPGEPGYPFVSYQC